MIKINIIPDAQKKERALKQKMGAILQFGSKLAFSFLILIAVLFSIQLILSVEYKAAKEDSAIRVGKADKNVEAIEKLLADANAVSQKANKTSSSLANWSTFLEKISSLCPENAKINSIHVEGNHIKLAGFSKTREAFLELQENFKKEGFKNFISPVSNLVSPQNFSFELEFDIEKNNLSTK